MCIAAGRGSRGGVTRRAEQPAHRRISHQALEDHRAAHRQRRARASPPTARRNGPAVLQSLSGSSTRARPRVRARLARSRQRILHHDKGAASMGSAGGSTVSPPSGSGTCAWAALRATRDVQTGNVPSSRSARGTSEILGGPRASSSGDLFEFEGRFMSAERMDARCASRCTGGRRKPPESAKIGCTA